jgi:hypothetical protein
VPYAREGVFAWLRSRFSDSLRWLAWSGVSLVPSSPWSSVPVAGALLLDVLLDFYPPCAANFAVLADADSSGL